MKLKATRVPYLDGCARCGKRHGFIVFLPLTKPVPNPGTICGHQFTHWAPCPDNGEPILMKVSDV